MGALNAAINFGVMITTPLLLGEAYGLHGLGIGMLIFPGAICASVTGYYGGKLIDRKGNRFVATLALFLLSTGLLSLSAFAGYAAWGGFIMPGTGQYRLYYDAAFPGEWGIRHIAA